MLAGRKGARVYLWLPLAPKEVARRSGQSSRMEEEDGSFFLCFGSSVTIYSTRWRIIQHSFAISEGRRLDRARS